MRVATSLALLLAARFAASFSVTASLRLDQTRFASRVNQQKRPKRATSCLSALPEASVLETTVSTLQSTTAHLADEVVSSSSWRQYVPLVVSAMVLLDIVLGSPAANSVLSVAQRQVDEKSKQGEASDNNQSTAVSAKAAVSSKPRINVDAVVEQALGKAENMQSLREYLDARKTDADRMREIRKKQDEQMARLDQKNNIMDEL